VVSNLTEGSKRRVENVQAAVEPDLLYPLLRGRDVGRWQTTPSAHILVTHKPGMGLKAIPEGEMATRLPRTYAYLKHFETELRSRSGYRRYFRETDPFYSIFNVGDYTFAPYKVVWRYIASDFTCAVVSSTQDQTLGRRLVIPDHRLMLVPFESPEEAHYLCSVLNSGLARYLVQTYTIGTQISTHVLENLDVSRFKSSNPLHRQLAVLSEQAHEATAARDAARVQEIEAETDRLAAELWGLTEVELREIQESLAELK